jgi:hypothetical protein
MDGSQDLVTRDVLAYAGYCSSFHRVGFIEDDKVKIECESCVSVLTGHEREEKKKFVDKSK